MDNLIFDRTQNDVNNAINNPSSSEFLKGAYNYTDLNRVEEWSDYIKDILNDYGANLNFNVKTDWNMRDYPTRLQINRIRNNISSLKNACYALLTENIEYGNTLDYEKANALEKILYDINKHIEGMTKLEEAKIGIGSTITYTKYITFNRLEAKANV